MKPDLLPNLQCLACGGELSFEADGACLACRRCGQAVPTHAGIPMFTPPPGELVPSEKLVRGPDVGTPWRQANWRFLEGQISQLGPEALILDAGAGRGDFAALFEGRHCLALDVYPYPEVDLVCDLTQAEPLRAERFDAIALMNVMEHVYDTHALLAALSRLLKPQGLLIVAIPFLVKIHQAPVDFVRYTHFALQRLGEQHRLETSLLEGYYDPVFFLGEGIGNLKWSILPAMRGSRRYLARGLLAGIQFLASALHGALGQGRSLPPASVKSMAPTGYHVVYRRKRD
jgi:SAM-dependent methyltransferase/uncharacterized protein YbaR (Trm112 family)